MTDLLLWVFLIAGYVGSNNFNDAQSLMERSSPAGGECDGCELDPLIYVDDYYSGDGYVPGLIIDITLGAGSDHGHCDGWSGECFRSGCVIGKITVWITNNRTEDVVVTGMGGGPSVIVPAGGGAGFVVGQAPPLSMECHQYILFDALKLEVPNEDFKNWIIAIRCTACA